MEPRVKQQILKKLDEVKDCMSGSSEPQRADTKSIDDYRQLIGEGMLIQRGKKKGGVGGKSKCGKNVMVSVCKMEQSKGKGRYKKTGGYVEVRVRSSSTYEEFSEAAANALDVSLSLDDEEEEIEEDDDFEQTHGDKQLALFRCDGTKVLNTSVDGNDWTVHRYMSTFPSYLRTGSTVKMGVGIVYSHMQRQPGVSTTVSQPVIQKCLSTSKAPAAGETVDVKYSALIGGVGVDISKRVTREAVLKDVETIFSLTKAQRGNNFYPECHHYVISSIDRDYYPLMWINDDGRYVVMDDDNPVKMKILYQSPSVVRLGLQPIPLYCIASGHKMEYKYHWTCRERTVGTNSPVLWVVDSGLYRCEVAHNLTTEKCVTSLIQVIAVQNHAEVNAIDLTRVEADEQLTSHSNAPSRHVVDHASASVHTSAASEQSSSAPSEVSMLFEKAEIELATDSFASGNRIGKGAYGTVFIAKNLRSVGTTAAIKVLNESGVKAVALNGQGAATQLHTEIKALTKYRHPNLVSLMGYCCATDNFICLVYEYMENGSLYHRLHLPRSQHHPLNWDQRVKILQDTCRGLAYLHAGKPPLIHQDIKSLNILLAHETAKLGDFGFALDMPAKHAEDHTAVTLVTAPMLAQTNGYSSPEIQSGKISPKSDVYSYGIVMLEVYSGQRAWIQKREDSALSEHLEDNLTSLDKFKEVSDSHLPLPQEMIADFLYSTITDCLKRHSQRTTSAKIMECWAGLQCRLD